MGISEKIVSFSEIENDETLGNHLEAMENIRNLIPLFEKLKDYFSNEDYTIIKTRLNLCLTNISLSRKVKTLYSIKNSIFSVRNLISEKDLNDFHTIINYIYTAEDLLDTDSLPRLKSIVITHEEYQKLHTKIDELETQKANLEKLGKINSDLSMDVAGLQSVNQELKKRLNTLMDERSKNTQARIDQNITTYVQDVSDRLQTDSNDFYNQSRFLNAFGILFLIFAVVFGMKNYLNGLDDILNKENITFLYFLYAILKGSVAIILLLFISITCFSNARKYAHESIRRKDMQHAMMFGRLFLQIYGGNATKEDAKTVFKDWNRSGKTAFSDKFSIDTEIQNNNDKERDSNLDLNKTTDTIAESILDKLNHVINKKIGTE